VTDGASRPPPSGLTHRLRETNARASGHFQHCRMPRLVDTLDRGRFKVIHVKDGAGFLRSDEVAVLLRCSVRTVHELTRRRAIPHRKAPATRRCLFIEHEVRAWLDGAQLETIDLGEGGRVVRIATD
jgi:predicted DNA-binding transcriptional regulator AlpA